MDRDGVLAFAGSAPLITDDLPYVEFTGPKAVDMSTAAANYIAVTRHAMSPVGFLADGVAESNPELLVALEAPFELARGRWEMAAEAQDRRNRDLEEARRSGVAR